MDGEPTAIERSYLPHVLCPGILEYDFSTNSLYETLSTVYDKRPDHAEQVIEASLATPEVCQLLEQINGIHSLWKHRKVTLQMQELYFANHTKLCPLQRTSLKADHTAAESSLNALLASKGCPCRAPESAILASLNAMMSFRASSNERPARRADKRI